VGLAGGIASGKSSIMNLLRELGDGSSVPPVCVHTIDADKLGHAAYATDTECYKKVVEYFGPLVAKRSTPDAAVHSITNEDGAINRAELGPIVFGDSTHMRALEGMVWPEIKRQLVAAIRERYRGIDADSPDTVFASVAPDVSVDPRVIVLVEAAVMIEAGFVDLLDLLLVSHVDPTQAIQRLMCRNNLSADQAQARIDAQLSNAQRLAHAHMAICNDGDEAALAGRVREVWAVLLSQFVWAQEEGLSCDSCLLAQDEVARRAAALKARHMPVT
jgi:dephospho-CoA kinase